MVLRPKSLVTQEEVKGLQAKVRKQRFEEREKSELREKFGGLKTPIVTTPERDVRKKVYYTTPPPRSRDYASNEAYTRALEAHNLAEEKAAKKFRIARVAFIASRNPNLTDEEIFAEVGVREEARVEAQRAAELARRYPEVVRVKPQVIQREEELRSRIAREPSKRKSSIKKKTFEPIARGEPGFEAQQALIALPEPTSQTVSTPTGKAFVQAQVARQEAKILEEQAPKTQREISQEAIFVREAKQAGISEREALVDYRGRKARRETMKEIDKNILGVKRREKTRLQAFPKARSQRVTQELIDKELRQFEKYPLKRAKAEFFRETGELPAVALKKEKEAREQFLKGGEERPFTPVEPEGQDFELLAASPVYSGVETTPEMKFKQQLLKFEKESFKDPFIAGIQQVRTKLPSGEEIIEVKQVEKKLTPFGKFKAAAVVGGIAAKEALKPDIVDVALIPIAAAEPSPFGEAGLITKKGGQIIYKGTKTFIKALKKPTFKKLVTTGAKVKGLEAGITAVSTTVQPFDPTPFKVGTTALSTIPFGVASKDKAIITFFSGKFATEIIREPKIVVQPEFFPQIAAGGVGFAAGTGLRVSPPLRTLQREIAIFGLPRETRPIVRSLVKSAVDVGKIKPLKEQTPTKVNLREIQSFRDLEKRFGVRPDKTLRKMSVEEQVIIFGSVVTRAFSKEARIPADIDIAVKSPSAFAKKFAKEINLSAGKEVLVIKKGKLQTREGSTVIDLKPIKKLQQIVEVDKAPSIILGKSKKTIQLEGVRSITLERQTIKKIQGALKAILVKGEAGRRRAKDPKDVVFSLGVETEILAGQRDLLGIKRRREARLRKQITFLTNPETFERFVKLQPRVENFPFAEVPKDIGTRLLDPTTKITIPELKAFIRKRGFSVYVGKVPADTRLRKQFGEIFSPRKIGAVGVASFKDPFRVVATKKGLSKFQELVTLRHEAVHVLKPKFTEKQVRALDIDKPLATRRAIGRIKEPKQKEIFLEQRFKKADKIIEESLLPERQKPSILPSRLPKTKRSVVPSKLPSQIPSRLTSTQPSVTPSTTPSQLPSLLPSATPSQVPSQTPSVTPSKVPSTIPSILPSRTTTTSPQKIIERKTRILPERQKPKQQGYDVLIKDIKRDPRNKEKIVETSYVKANKKPLTKGDALSFGARIVDNSQVRTYKIRKTTKKVRMEGDDYYKDNRKKFRSTKKRGRVQDTGKIIEKTTYAIDSYGEVADIPWRGIAKQQRQRRQLGSTGSILGRKSRGGDSIAKKKKIYQEKNNNKKKKKETISLKTSKAKGVGNIAKITQLPTPKPKGGLI